MSTERPRLELLRRAWPVVAIYAATRVYDTILFELIGRAAWVPPRARPAGYHSFVDPGVPPGYRGVTTSWDGQWYWDVAVRGYPSTFLGAHGEPEQTSLAFFPAYPFVSRLLMRVTGLGFDVVGPTLSLLLGLVAVLLVARLVDDAMGRTEARWCVALLCCFISAPVLQMAYTESMALAILAGFLILVRRERYAWAAGLALVAGVTRNLAPVLIVVVLVHWYHLGRKRPARHAPIAGLLAAVAASALLWPLAVGLMTGRADGYTKAVQAWPGFTDSILKSPWLTEVGRGGLGAIMAAVVLGAVFALLLLRRQALAWGVELWAVGVFLPLYVVFASGAAPSLARYFLLAFPLGLLLVPTSRNSHTRTLQHVVAGAACLVGLGSQAWWIHSFVVAGPLYP